MKNIKPYILVLVIALIIGAIYFINSTSVKRNSEDIINVTPRLESKQEKAEKYELAKEITTPDGFINTSEKDIKISDYIGKKVILVDFWTYSCINCQRTTPYLNSWYDKYKDKGFVILGIHTPEFEFEKDYNNVKIAVEKLGIKFPIILDNDFSTWNAYKNRYWPRKYLIDIDGYIVYDHIGEGRYEETEKHIQEALRERMAILEENETINQSLTREIVVQNEAKSPETYFGALRNELLGNGKTFINGNQKFVSMPDELKINTLYLYGDWNISDEFAQNESPLASIIYKYNARELFFVASADNEIIVEVLSDGKPISIKSAGSDIIRTSMGKTILKIKEAGLYKIIQNTQSEIHNLELKIKESGLKAFTFTFG